MENSTLKKIMYALIAVAVALAGTLAYIWYQKTSLVKELTIDKEELTAQMVELQNDYASLSSDYDSINSQLDSSREEVSQLIARIQKTEATNRSKMRQYEKELGTLRTIMRGYIVQIDSLNTLNKKLTADAAAARREAAESRKREEALNKTVESLSGQVAAGSVLKARGIRIEAYNASDKVTDRSSRVVRLLTSLSLVENDLAPKGPVRVYIRVKGPDGILLTNSTQRTFEFIRLFFPGDTFLLFIINISANGT
jgi:myosin heavy subunit